MPALREQGHQLGDAPLLACDAHLARHDLADRLRLLRVHRAVAPNQRSQSRPDALRAMESRVVQKVRNRHDADDSPSPVDDWEGLDAVLPQQGPGRVEPEPEPKRYGQWFTRHDVCAPQLPEIAFERRCFRKMQQFAHIVATYVEHLLIVRQVRVHVSVPEAGCGRPGGRRSHRPMRIAAPGEGVEKHARTHEQERIHQHREQREVETHRPHRRHRRPRRRVAGSVLH